MPPHANGRAMRANVSTCATSASRRALLLGTLTYTLQGLAAPEPAAASLVQFPADKLNNKYYLVGVVVVQGADSADVKA